MKTSKLLLTILLLSSSTSIWAQFNPINNLQYEQWYEFMNSNCPAFNCFNLSWEIPDASNDTLLGYNVYRNNEFWIFTDHTQVTCPGICTCDYMNFYDPIPFWITVVALYNSDSSESVIRDSVHVADIMINIEEIKGNEILITKNPIIMGENISILIPEGMGTQCKVRVYSLNGRLHDEFEMKIGNDQLIEFPSDKLKKGMYLISIQAADNIITTKMLIQ